MKTSEDTSVKNEIVTGSGRVFRPVHEELLEKLPPEIREDMAKRRQEEIAAAEKEK
jgi:hypothetical protein